MEHEHLIPIIRAITLNNSSKETSKNAILTLYNVTSCKSPGLDNLVTRGVIRLLIRLSVTAGPDMTPACAIALAHIKHIQKDRDLSAEEGGDELYDEMEEGIMTTLLSMIDLDQTSIQKVDRMAVTLAANLPPLRPSEWVFISGNTSIRLDSQLPVSWTFHNSSIDDARFVPAEPKSFLGMLSPVVPATGVTVQNKLSGSFQIIKVREDKYRIKRLDPRFLSAASISNSSTDSLTDAISIAMSDGERDRDSHTPSPSIADTLETASTSDQHVSDSEGEEVRSVSPVKKKSSTVRGGISRTGSNNGHGIGVLMMDRRSSKTNHKSSKPLVQQETKTTADNFKKKESQRNSKLFSSADSDHGGVILPKIQVTDFASRSCRQPF
ncbi:hypothetical protein FI667_g3980, partial [Globisporangium splendens]